MEETIKVIAYLLDRRGLYKFPTRKGQSQSGRREQASRQSKHRDS